MSEPINLYNTNQNISQNTKQNTNVHIPVMLDEVKNYLLTNRLEILQQKSQENPQEKTVNLFDGTLGGGGYTQEFINIANTHNLNLNQYSSDLDQTAIDRVLSYIQCPDHINLELRQGNFADVIEQFEDEFFDGIVVDLGFSSNQLEVSGRGFSYLHRDEPLDLRYDQNTSHSCSYRLLAIHNWQQLGKIIYDYSGEDLAARIAKAVYNSNKKTPWTVGEFVDLVITVIPITALKRKNQIMSRVWQALRIWVNGEFDSLNKFLPIALTKLNKGGRLVVVSFHSLEDKIVTKFMRDECKPVSEDDFGNKTFDYKLLTVRPLAPTPAEITANPRSRSAMTRVIEKLN